MTTKCIKCDGTGIVYIPNGEDDFDTAYCICASGEALEIEHEKERIAHDKFKMADMVEDALAGADVIF